MPTYPGFIGGSSVAHSEWASGERTVNYYVERMDSATSPFPLALYPSPGMESVAEATSSPGRGSLKLVHQGTERAFCVIGTLFGELSSVYGLTVIGAVAVDSHPATLAWNGDGGGQVLVASGDKGYLYDLDSGVFSTVRTSATTMVVHLDGYFLALDTNTSTVYRSALLDGTSWDGTEFHQRSIASDPWVAIAVLDRYLWHFGTETTEVWYNQGSLNDPFVPHPSGLVPYGCIAPFSVQVVSGTLMWLSQTTEGNGAILRTSGFSPEVVSTFAAHIAVEEETRIEDAIGDVYEDLGHTFYLLTLPTVGRTLCYDATQIMQIPASMRWTDRGTWLSEENRFDAWRPLYHLFVFGQHLALDRTTGDVLRLHADLGFDADERPLRRVRRPQGVWSGNRRVFVAEFEVFAEPGLGLATGQGSDPQMALRVSVNGGKTWGAERSRSAGELGNYTARMRWHRCGSGRYWVPELVVTDPVPWRLVGAQYRGTPMERAA